MIDNNTPSFTSRFIYYRNDKIMPSYVGRVASSFEAFTASNNRFNLKYNGHKRNNFNFTLLDGNKEVLECTVQKEPDFLDHSSFKYLSRDVRESKIYDRAKALKDIMVSMMQKYLN